MLTLIGRGRIGGALAEIAEREGVDHQVIERSGDRAALGDRAGPIVVCTRNDDVAGVVEGCARPHDLVFVQNGAILPWAEARGLGGCTFGQLYFAVPTRGATPEAGADSLFYGPHAPGLVYLLRRAGIPAQVLGSPEELRKEAAIKLLWGAIFGLLGDVHRETVLASCARHEEVAGLVEELAPVCARGLDAAVPTTEVTARLLAYSHAIGSWRASVREWPWRNGWIVQTAAASGLACPTHDALLARWREAGGVY